MILVLLIALGLFGASVVLALRAAAVQNARGRQTIEHIGAYGFRADQDGGRPRPRTRESLSRLATSMGSLYSRYASKDREREIRDLLRSAGMYRMRPVTFFGYRILASAGLGLLFLWLLGAAGANPLLVFFLVICFGTFGWLLPMFVLRTRAKQRLEQIDLEVPELVDLLVTTIEAGIGFAAALQTTARRVEGALGEELRVALSEQGMGLTINEALRNMLGRANSPALRVFVQAILQGETLGVSIGKIMRDLAIDMRKRRRQAAEERAQKAPTKIIFPLALLILPALFIVCLGPILVAFLHGFN